MKIKDFELEVFFGKYEFTAPYLLTQSDCETMAVEDLLKMEEGSLEELLKSRLGYTEVEGDLDLRRIIASLYEDLNEENILVHTGAQEGIFAFMNVFLNPDDHVISMNPIYQSLYEVAAAKGCKVSKWELVKTEGKWSVDFESLRNLIEENTKLIVINTPNNPTGLTLSKEELEELVEIARERNIYIFADEVYKGLSYNGEKLPWLVDLYERGVSLGVMSKAYGLAGLRIGWLASRDRELLENIIKYKHYLSISNSSTSELLTKIALKNSEEILKRNTDIIVSNLKYANEFFEKYEDLFENNIPDSGPIAFHRLKTGESIDDFSNELVEKKGVLLLPASVYGIEGNYFRMGYGRNNFKECLDIFEAFIKEKYNR